MGIKISSLPVNALPYTGAEKLPIVQNGETRGGTLSSFVNYLSGALLSDSELRALSGNWQNTYTSYSSNSANYAVKNANNNFTNTQTISVVDTTKVKFGTYKTEINASNANILFGYNATTTTDGSYNISIGVKANAIGLKNIVIGTHDTSNTPQFDTFSEDNISIGSNIELNGKNCTNDIVIGTDIYISSSNSENNILIGSGANISSFSDSTKNIVIGAFASSGGNENIVAGNGAVSNFSNCIVFGYNASPTESNQLALGGLTVGSGTLSPTNYLPVSINGVVYYILLCDELS